MQFVREGVNFGGKELSIETGRMAKQADGSVVVRYGDTMVLVTAVASSNVRPGVDFMPLTVDYREYAYASGRIPGGFFKREGKMADKEVLTSRMIDRPIRPLFPAGWRHETQIIALVLSADRQNDADVLAITGASAGVGRATAERFARSGARIGLIARDDDRLQASAAEVERFGGEALVLPFDVADHDSVEAAASEIEERFGPLDRVERYEVETVWRAYDLPGEG